MTVNHVNHPTLPNTDAYTIAQDGLLTVTTANGLLANDLDIDGDTLLVTNIHTSVSHGTLQMVLDGSFTYKPDSGYSGPDSFTYIVNDGTVDSGPVTVKITVTHVNQPPLAGNDVYNLPQNSVLTVPAKGLLNNDLDADGDQLFVLNLGQPAHGLLHQNNDGGFTYTPDFDFEGVDSYTYMAYDGKLSSVVATVTLNVHHVNHAPVAQSNSYSIAQNTVLQVDSLQGVLSNDSDPEANLMTAILLTQTQHGTLHMEKDGSFKYTPNTNYVGSDSFSYQSSDGKLSSNIVSVTIKVNDTNQAPVAVDDSYTIASNTALQVSAANGLQANDSDPDGDVLKVIIATQPQHGTLHALPDGSFIYQPSPDPSNGISLSHYPLRLRART
ncbi:Ig-like domain-containing protein, partial [Bathymodiolus platifrons methanotrophic gill symbiont]|uniref:Ig-like domain-containing protein n=1 Tax=Bathymodiolus platifrons methanotrophic gill symbiont TaxID=113268 RepID=UPI001FCD9C3D